MHSIERYGIVALLFLVVTVVAVLMWDGGKAKNGKKQPLAGLTPAASAPLEPAPAPADEPDHRLSLTADSQPGPLQRQPAAPARDPAVTPQPLAETPAATAQSAPLAEAPSGAPLYDAPLSSVAAGAPAAREPAPKTKPAAAGRTYTVRGGDTLSEIAQRELGSSKRWREIVAANPGLDPAKLRLGSTIRIPGGSEAGPVPAPPQPRAAEPKAASAPKAATTSKPAAGGKTWKVGPGESLWRIAEKALGDGKRWREIAALNPKVDPDRLNAGTVLVLPAGAASSAPAKAAPAPKRSGSPTVVASSAGTQRPARSGGRVR